MDGYLDGSTEGFAGRLEVIEGRSGRRLRRPEERARIAAESLVPGVRVADVARRHGVTRWQVYDWRRKLASGALALPEEAMREPAFAPLVVERPAVKASGKQRARKVTAAVRIELVVAGVTVRVGADVDEGHLARVIRAVRAADE
jgi:transposase